MDVFKFDLKSVVADNCSSSRFVVGGIMRASGVVLMPMAISIFCIICVQLPVAYLLDLRLGLPGVWMAFPIAYLAMLVLQSAYYRLVWRFRRIERLV